MVVLEHDGGEFGNEHLVDGIHLSALLLIIQGACAVEMGKTFVENVESLHDIPVERLFVLLHKGFDVQNFVAATLLY